MYVESVFSKYHTALKGFRGKSKQTFMQFLWLMQYNDTGIELTYIIMLQLIDLNINIYI